jgi:hypothetical protein
MVTNRCELVDNALRNPKPSVFGDGFSQGFSSKRAESRDRPILVFSTIQRIVPRLEWRHQFLHHCGLKFMRRFDQARLRGRRGRGGGSGLRDAWNLQERVSH